MLISYGSAYVKILQVASQEEVHSLSKTHTLLDKLQDL